MSQMKPEVSERNPYRLPKHRYYELKHFCLQYPDWQNQLRELDGHGEFGFADTGKKTPRLTNPTERIAIKRAALSEKVHLVEESARAADETLAPYLLAAVTEGYGFDTLKTTMDIPCERDMYYNRYRRFFAVLNVLKEG